MYINPICGEMNRPCPDIDTCTIPAKKPDYQLPSSQVSHFLAGFVYKSYGIENKFLNPKIEVRLNLDPFINPICGQMCKPWPYISKKI